GTGDFCRLLDAHGYRAIGVDFSMGMLENARTLSPLIQADALSLPVVTASVDGATCGFALRNFVDLNAFFEEVARVVRPGGRIALLDASTPNNPVIRAGHAAYFGKVVPLIGGLLSDPSAYRYLPKSLAYLPPREEMLANLANTGFTNVQARELTGGAALLISA